MQRNVPLAPLTTLGIGGPAKFFVEAHAIGDVVEATKFDGPLLFLAGGSNVLISDEGFPGLVVHLKLRGVRFEGDGVVRAKAGEPWDSLVSAAVSRKWAGIECLSGIPGSAGATPIQNVGAYGQDVSETITAVEVFDRQTRNIATLTNAECGFGYRTSRFKKENRFVVLSVTYKLTPGGEPSIRYPELQKFVGDAADLQQVRDAVIAIRRKKGMVIDPADPDSRSDGSFFTNPIVDPALAAGPQFPANDGKVKLSAAWLIENAGFHKGFVHGNVGLSSKHTLAIINLGGGTAREVLELVAMIQAAVREKFGVELHPEPVFVGSDLRSSVFYIP